jgi:phage-related protein
MQCVIVKPVTFLGDSLDALRAFPTRARQRIGYQLDRVQRGVEPDDWKPMRTIGAGVREIRVRDESGAFRAIYVASLEDAVYVLHCFQKRTQRTSRRDLELAAQRLKNLARGRR